MRRTCRAAAAALFALVGLAAIAAEPRTDALVPGFSPTPTPVSPHGTRAVIDLPVSQHLRNVGGSDGAGLCVGTSLTHSARFQGVRELDGFRPWLQGRPGGSYPEKLAADLKEYCGLKGVPVPRYVMGTGVDTRLMELAYQTRRCPAITHTAAHMVSGMHLDSTEGAILDNNYPGRWEWASTSRYVDVYSQAPRGRYGWVVVLLAPPPPPGTDALAPQPAPAPVPPVNPLVDPFARPRPCPGPYCPRADEHVWDLVRYADGSIGQKLYLGGRLLGLLDERGWHPAVGRDSWTIEPAGEPPFPPPAPAAGDVGGGVELGRLDLSRPRYWVDGEEVAEHVAFGRFVTGQVPGPPGLTDDSDKYHLTLAVPAGTQAGAAATLLGRDTSKVHVQVYTPADWPVQSGRVKPGVTLQEPAGKGGRVRYQSPDAGTVGEALRYTDPAYPPPVKPVTPAPVVPTPSPAPPKVDPAPPVCPCPSPCPCPEPDPPKPRPVVTGASWLTAILLGLWSLLSPVTRKDP
ncbi:MAG TPA: hypothetical protein VH092_37790 [Urbifossiella sp.]|jgi:hypothetical protein|nr:hypothetical protein [Urbifossiella sp.]